MTPLCAERLETSSCSPQGP